MILPENKFFNTNFFYLIILIFFSFSINFYYSNLGVFPIDTFLHYDSAYKIFKNEAPIKDYWIVSGIVIDYIQSIFFKVFGVSWTTYILHSSLFNSFLAAFTYYFFLSSKLETYKAFFYSLSFSILAYPISGTPFVDHHATFFAFIATFLIIKGLHTQKNYFWFLAVFFFFLSFFSKQVPASYLALLYSLLLLIYLLKKKEFKLLIFIFLSVSFFSILTLFFLLINNINIKEFYIQYLGYPRYIGQSRLDNFDLSFHDIFNRYKFIILPIILIIFMKFKRLKENKMRFLSNEFISFLIIITFSAILIFHQIMTKNQIYIYFLIPILFILFDIELDQLKFNLKKYVSIGIMIVVSFITLKYHFGFNETRKFHELQQVNLKNAINAVQIDETFKNLKLVNPLFKGDPLQEILIINKVKKALEQINDKEIMLITHYQFLDSITKKNLNYPNRTFLIDGTSMPLKQNRYYEYYKDFLKNKISKKKIEELYFLKHENLSLKVITEYIDDKCYVKSENDIFYIFKLKCLN